MPKNAKDRNNLTHINYNYYEQEAIELLPSFLNLLIDARVEDLQYDLRIYETHPTATKTENEILYAKICRDILHLDEETYYECGNEDKINLINKAYLFTFLFYSKKVTEIVLKELMEQGYKVNINTEIFETQDGSSDEEYKYIEILWSDEALNS